MKWQRTLILWAAVQESWLVAERLVDALDEARDGGKDVRGGLYAFDSSDLVYRCRASRGESGSALSLSFPRRDTRTLLCDLAALYGELDKDDVAERLLGVFGDAHGSDFLRAHSV